MELEVSEWDLSSVPSRGTDSGCSPLLAPALSFFLAGMQMCFLELQQPACDLEDRPHTPSMLEQKE